MNLLFNSKCIKKLIAVTSVKFKILTSGKLNEILIKLSNIF